MRRYLMHPPASEFFNSHSTITGQTAFPARLRPAIPSSGRIVANPDITHPSLRR
jgi:hypothetical protein